MIQSMTGFASAVEELPAGVLSLELKAVNNRFLDLQLRLPEELRSLEGALRERLSRALQRGKVECRVNWNAHPAAHTPLEVDEGLIQRLLAVSQTVQQLAPNSGTLRLSEILRWPGVLSIPSVEPEVLQRTTLLALDRALEDFIATRTREGGRLVELLLERIAKMRESAEVVAQKMPEALQAYRVRLETRLMEALGTLDDDRVRQEVVLFTQKADVDEELDRLKTHLKEVERILKTGGAVGKRLDFLMQELNREANTLGSKSIAPEISSIAVELKVLIEQMREQVQNLE